MFGGIVEETGTVVGIQELANGIRLRARARLSARGVKPGDSIAVNGCCLTLEKATQGGNGGSLQFSLLQETWRLTNLQFCRAGSSVNLERALRLGDRLGGHFVTGHIDGMGKIVRWEREGRDYVLEIAAATPLLRQMALKGSIAVDGISLTVAGVGKKSFRVWIIPHTYEVTALRERKAGDWVNLETDLFSKYVERHLTGR